MQRLITTMRTHRARMHLTISELAELTGMTHKSISAIELGRTVPSTICALTLAKTFGLTVEELFMLEVCED